jgi:ABC-2 type transport system permease protein
MKIFDFLKKEFLTFKRNKKQAGVVIALPLAFAIIYTLMFSFSSMKISLSVCNLDKGDYSGGFAESLSDGFSIDYYSAANSSECFAMIKEDIISGSILGMVIPSDFSQKLINHSSPAISLFIDNSKPNIGFFAQSLLASSLSDFNTEVVAAAQDSLRQSTSGIKNDLEATINVLEIMKPTISYASLASYNLLYSNLNSYRERVIEINNFNLGFIVKPVNINLLGIFEGENNKGFSFSILYIVLASLVILLLSSMGIIYDKKNNLIVRLRAAKNNLLPYMISKIIFFSIIGLLVFIPPFLVFLIDGAYFSISFLSLIASIIIISSTWALMGCIIGFGSKDESSGIMISIFAGLLVLLLSGLFYPLEFMPPAIKYVTMIFPISLHSSMIGNALVFNAGFGQMSEILVSGIIYIAILSAICAYFLLKPIKD